MLNIRFRTWKKRQNTDEISYWFEWVPKNRPEQYNNKDKFHFEINKNMFTNLNLNFEGGRVLDVGCGPFGMLPYVKARAKIGIEPLVEEFNRKGAYENDVVILKTIAENIPLPSEFVDAVYCMNALDHFHKPYKALDEIFRVLKKGGVFSFGC